jgi:hypothetical protein
MTNETKNMETSVETVDINLDEIFDGAPSAEGVTLPEETKGNIFKNMGGDVDLTFTETAKVEETEEVKETEDTKTEESEVEFNAETFKKAEEVFDELDDLDDEVEQKVEKRGRKRISGISDVFSKLIKDDKIVPFDDDKNLEDYSAKDWEELIEANLEERANQVRRETPKQFFESLPEELQIAARYVADGGQDLKGLFSTLAYVEESRQLDISDEGDQESIIREYLSVTGYGNREEIEEEIEIWKDLGKLEKQASKFKPKLDKMKEQVVARKLQEQEMKRAQQEQASKQYMSNVYHTLKDGTLGNVRVDKKTQAMLYNGLVQPNYPSVSGRNTNLLGHLLEKYQFVEPNYTLIAEALWLLSDPVQYKAKIMSKGAQKNIEKTVRKLKTEQANNKTTSHGIQKTEQAASRKSKKKLQRSNNIFRRI